MKHRRAHRPPGLDEAGASRGNHPRPATTVPRPLDVAIVGLACRFPGAPDLLTFWSNLLAGRLPAHDGRLEDPARIDLVFLGLDPEKAAAMDPAALLVLDAARSALDDAGLPLGLPDGRRIELVLGRAATDRAIGDPSSEIDSTLHALHPEWSEADFAAIRADLASHAESPPELASFVARPLGVRGLSYVVEAGYASAIVALGLGARALTSRRADLALVGALHLPASEPFGNLEGVGLVVLKRLPDAIRDGHRIYAVLKGLGAAGPGRGDAHGQKLAEQRAYRRAGIDPATVGLIAGQGRDGIDEVPRNSRGKASIRLQTGRGSGAEGMAGLIANALALHHRMLVPAFADQTRTTRPGPTSRRPSLARPWVHGEPGHPRRAAVHVAQPDGLAGIAVIEEHADSADDPTAPGALLHWDSEAILLGAEDRLAWIALARALIDWLDARPEVSLKDVAYTLNVGQPNYPFRVGLVVSSLDDLRARLRDAADRLADPDCDSLRDVRGAFFASEPMGGPGRLAFLFPGEGSQYAGMLADLYPHFPEIRRPFDWADRVAIERGLTTLPSEIVFGGSSPGEIWSMGTAIGLVLSAQWGLHELLSRLGVTPDAVAGHSSGEFLALAAAGVVRIDRRFEGRLASLGALFDMLESSGAVPSAALVAVAADRARVEAACREAGASAEVAADNGPRQVVVAVATDRVGPLVGSLRDAGLACEPLPFARAYHTPAFAPALAPIRRFFDLLPLRPPRIPVYSCAGADRMPDSTETIRRLAVEQWARPVAFRDLIESLHADGVRIFVEVGTRGLLTGFVEEILRNRPGFAVAANLPRRSGLTQLNHLVATLYAQGVAIRPDHLYVRRRPRRIDFGSPRRSSGTIAVPLHRRPPGPSPDLVAAIRSRYARPFDESLPTRAELMQLAESDEGLRAFLQTMDEFTEIQREVLAAYLARRFHREADAM